MQFKATINGDLSGYGQGAGPGAGLGDCVYGASGASHGGYGGTGGGAGGSNPYGDTRSPVTVGSGGGTSCSDGVAGAGGGAVHLIANTFQLNGTITTHG